MKSIKPGIRQPRAAIAGHLAALAAVAMWGYSFVSSRELLINELGPVQIYVLRFLLAYFVVYAESLVLVEQTKHYGGDKRRHRREQRNIGGQRVLQRSVLGNKIERTAGEAAKHHEKFVGERGGEQALVADAQHHEIGQNFLSGG